VSDADPGPYLPPFGDPQWPDDGLCHRIQIAFEVPSGPGVEIIAAEFLLEVVQGFTRQGLTPDSLTLQIDSRLRPER
jgi:hypothetical protein